MRRLVLATMRLDPRSGSIAGVGTRTTVLIVDDHDGFCRSASALLEMEGFDVVGCVSDGETGVVEAGKLRPDVVLLDVQLPGLSGFEVAQRLAAASEPPCVVLISSRDAFEYGPRLVTVPARGFIPKRDLSGRALAALVG